MDVSLADVPRSLVAIGLLGETVRRAGVVGGQSRNRCSRHDVIARPTHTGCGQKQNCRHKFFATH